MQFDSSQLEVSTVWPKIADIIRTHANMYRGFVITHGTDTLAYSAAAITFLLRHLQRPVIITGSQVTQLSHS